jgi:hypothetical protein
MRWYRKAISTISRDEVVKKIYESLGSPQNPETDQAINDAITQEEQSGVEFNEETIFETINRMTSTLEKLLNLSPVSYENFNKTKIPQIPSRPFGRPYKRQK